MEAVSLDNGNTCAARDGWEIFRPGQSPFAQRRDAIAMTKGRPDRSGRPDLAVLIREDQAL